MRPALVLTAVGSLLLALPGTPRRTATGCRTSELDGAWNLEPAVLVPARLALALFVQGCVRLRRRGRPDHAPWWRLVVFGLGLTLAVLVLVSPLDADRRGVPALGAHAAARPDRRRRRGARAARADGPAALLPPPGPVLGPLARVRPVRALVGVLSRPAVAFGRLGGVFAIWHVPAVYDAALDARWVHDLEHVTFVLAGFVMWYQLIDPARRGP